MTQIRDSVQLGRYSIIGGYVRTSRFASVVLLSALSTGVLIADQWTCISSDIAGRAEQLLAKNREVREFCAPCGDKEAKAIVVRNVQRIITPGGGACEIKLSVDGHKIDLAYLYVAAPDGRWENAAIVLALEVISSPRYLPGKGRLSLSQVEELIDLKAPDNVVAGEIKDRGLSFALFPQNV